MGGRLYGRFPDMLSGGQDEQGGWVPTTSRDRFHSVMAAWLGVPYGDLAELFPDLAADAGESNLEFLAG